MKNTNKTRAKNSARENTDLFAQKKSETRLIGYQDNTPTHINDLITEKAKKVRKDISEKEEKVRKDFTKQLQIYLFKII